MEKIFETINDDNSLYDVIYNSMNMQKEKDLSYVKEKYTGGILEEKIDQVEHDYSQNLDKLQYIPRIIKDNIDAAIQKKFTQTSLYIDYMDIDVGRKLDAILTFAALINAAPTYVEHLDNEKCYLVSTAMSSLPISMYTSYGVVLLNEKLLSFIVSKTPDMNERRKMIFEMYDYCDECVYDDMTYDEYKKNIEACMSIAKSYQLKSELKKIN